MIRSMTGFGRSSGKVGERLLISVLCRSVNHRYLEVSVRLPESLWEVEPMIRNLASRTFTRGKLDVTIRAERIQDPEYEVRLSRNIADRVLPGLRGLLAEYDIDANLTASDLLRIPDLVQVHPRESDLEEGEKEQVRATVLEAFEMLREMREQEGAALRSDIEAHLAETREGFARISTMRPEVQAEALENYRGRIEDLTRLSGVAVDPDRIAQETLIQVEKSDIAEELARAESHLSQMAALIDSNEPAGKKLDFLSQELLREINTSGQKSRSSGIRSLVVELKTAVERIREQVQNVE